MCGIAGIVKRHGPVAPHELEPAATALQHRGPDDRGEYIKGAVGLLHTRLSIIDLSGGHQPLVSADSACALSANGEVYNYLELREALTASGSNFATHSDCEVLLQGYLRDGIKHLEMVRGMFAFALHDGHRRQTWLARDRLGIKPLYYAVTSDRVVFASEIKAILTLLDRRPAVNPSALAQFLDHQFSSGRETIFKGIHRVLPGEAICINEDLALMHHRYWDANRVEPSTATPQAATTDFESLFHQVMVEHMRADVPFGLFLSGGVDSAVLLAMLQLHSPQRLQTFSVGYRDAAGEDELSQATALARRFGTDHHELRLTRDELFGRIPHVIWATDDLMRDYACLPTAALSQAAAGSLKVVFSGEGGDEVFAGYGRYHPSRAEAALKALLYPSTGGFRSSYQWSGSWRKRLYGPDLAAAARHSREPFVEAWRECPSNWSTVAKRQYVDLKTALPDNLLVKADRTMMAFGLEGRVPFLDHRVVEFGLGLPDAFKVEPGQGKVFLKRWAEAHLPKEVLWRPKRGFHVPIGQWMRGDILDQLEAALPANRGIQQWFVPGAIPDLVHAQRRNGSATRELFSLLQFAVWHQLFVEGAAPPPAQGQNPIEWLQA